MFIEPVVADPVALSPSLAGALSLAADIRGYRSATYSLWEHSRRVARTAARIASLHGLAVETAARAGFYHDVGKVRLRREVVFRPSELSAEEHRYLQSHPVVGERMAIGRLAPAVVEAIRWHHESLDGSGYPDGLTEAQIPLLARIVALADRYEAIREDRPYRPGRSVTTTLEILELEAVAGRVDQRLFRSLCCLELKKVRSKVFRH